MATPSARANRGAAEQGTSDAVPALHEAPWGRRPRTLIDPAKARSLPADFASGSRNRDLYEDVIPDILRFRADGWADGPRPGASGA
eukprot:CAMPEP_0176088636 /NCGR_PEP_ID=MMETSP0120_2-20121206/44380_1 /TAXON_ID=160619 /ORGANISM="Kryptoperidinium foliaceum, Strain CCMP 1326" /LENGTH=85 /DNA_ID=CAMNT_0017422493 /DNA_START=45 /DNA_END=298 /DNA_ORIENTATION=+